MFVGCSSLEHFKAPLPSLENGSHMFRGCDNLSVESLQNIVTTLPDRSQTSMGTLAIGRANIAKLSQEYLDLAVSKNWLLDW